LNFSFHVSNLYFNGEVQGSGLRRLILIVHCIDLDELLDSLFELLWILSNIRVNFETGNSKRIELGSEEALEELSHAFSFGFVKHSHLVLKSFEDLLFLEIFGIRL